MQKDLWIQFSHDDVFELYVSASVASACPASIPRWYSTPTGTTAATAKDSITTSFAPGWTVASLWELYSPQRTADFLK